MKSRNLLPYLLLLIPSLFVSVADAFAAESKGDCTISGPGEKTCDIADPHLLHGENGTRVEAVLTGIRIVLVEEYWENKTKWVFRYDISKIANNFDARLHVDFFDKDGKVIVNDAIVLTIDRSCPSDSAPAPRQGVIDYDYAPAVTSIRLRDDRVIVFDGPCLTRSAPPSPPPGQESAHASGVGKNGCCRPTADDIVRPVHRASRDCGRRTAPDGLPVEGRAVLSPIFAHNGSVAPPGRPR